jgi:hypothetical protein
VKKLVLSAFIMTGIALGGINLAVAGNRMENARIEQSVEQEWNWLGAVAQSLFGVKELEGEVISIDGDSMTVKDDKGNNYSIKVPEAEMLKELNSGDRLKITIEKVEPEG